MLNKIETIFSICMIAIFVGCGDKKPVPAPQEPVIKRAAWEDQPRDSKGRWISELTAYAQKHGITHEAAEAAKVPFEQYVYDYSLSHGPKLSAKELHDYEFWKANQKK